MEIVTATIIVSILHWHNDPDVELKTKSFEIEYETVSEYVTPIKKKLKKNKVELKDRKWLYSLFRKGTFLFFK